MIKPGDVVRNKHHRNLIYRILPFNDQCYGYVAPSGVMMKGSADYPAHYEKASLFDWWRDSLRWYVRNICWYLTFKTNKDLGLLKREIAYNFSIHAKYGSPNYFWQRFGLIMGRLPRWEKTVPQ